LRINLVFSHEKNGKAVPTDNEAIVEKPDRRRARVMGLCLTSGLTSIFLKKIKNKKLRVGFLPGQS